MTYKDALEILFEETPTDYILESDEMPEFYQFHVSCGGDACTYRVYKADGRITAK
jgi:hypothetical protein